MSVASLELEMGKAFEEFTQKARGLVDAHIAASHAELSAREQALNERERQLSERERGIDDRAKLLERRENAENEALPRESSEHATAQEALKQVEKGLDEAMIKSNQPERTKAALMVPSPTRARSNIPTPPPSAKITTHTALQNLQNLRAGPGQSFTSPRTHTSASPPVPPCSPPVACSPPLASSPPVATMVSSQLVRESPQSEEGNVARKVSAFSERKEKLLQALGTTFQGNSTCADDSMNMSMVSTPGRQGRGSNIGPAAAQKRQSLAELLNADQARLQEQVR